MFNTKRIFWIGYCHRRDYRKKYLTSHAAQSSREVCTPHVQLLGVLKKIPRKVQDATRELPRDRETEWIANKHGGLFINQLENEKTQLFEARNSLQELTSSLIRFGSATGLAKIQKLMLQWFEKLIKESTREVENIRKSETGKDRQVLEVALLFAFLNLDIAVIRDMGPASYCFQLTNMC